MNSPPPLATSMSNIIAFIMKKAEVTNKFICLLRAVLMVAPRGPDGGARGRKAAESAEPAPSALERAGNTHGSGVTPSSHFLHILHTRRLFPLTPAARELTLRMGVYCNSCKRDRGG